VSAVQHDLVVMPQGRPLSGSVPAPPDEDLSHLALLVAALSDGKSELRHVSKGAHMTALTEALRVLGVSVAAGSEASTIAVGGRTLRGLLDPRAPVDCGRSAPTLRRLAAVLVGHPFRTVLAADDAQPFSGVTDVAGALRRRAAQIEGVFAGPKAGALKAPFTVGPLPLDGALSGGEFELAEPRSDVKEALLLSGLYSDEATYVREPIVSRDHLERMLQACDVPVTAAGPIVALDPAQWNGRIEPFSFDVPGDVAAATLWCGLATLIPGSRVCVRGAGLNPTRTGAFDLMCQMGAEVELIPQATHLGETAGTVCAAYGPLRAVSMAGEILIRAGDDLPVLLALAARARGTTEIAGTDELGKGDPFVRSGSSTATMVRLLQAFGVEAASPDDGSVVVSGRPEGPLEAADVDAEADAARATTAVMLALLANGPSRIRNVDALADRFPRFVGTLRGLGADVRVEARG
jgi:3-phosphoshikimate 1-carboxyvinyltransferase